MSFKQSQGNQIYHENVDPEQGYINAKFERYRFHNFREKGNVKAFFFFFLTRKYANYLSSTKVEKKKKVVYSWYVWRNQQS